LTENSNPPAHELYSSHVEGVEASRVALRLWGDIPATMGEAHRLLVKRRGDYGEAPDALEKLKRAMKGNLRRMGVLTSKVEEGIDRMDRGVVETGQQPYCLGGSSLIFNKIAYIHSLTGLGDEDLAPLFYVADYDGVQPELLNTRLPSPSSRGLLISYPTGPEEINVPIYRVPNPGEEWLRSTLERIEGNYKGILGDVDEGVRSRTLQNLAHAFTVLRNSYHSTENVSDWSTKTIGSVVNLESDLGVPIYPFSTPGTRHLFQGGYELLLAEPNRSRFVEASNDACELVESTGYRSQIGLRSEDYVPFFLECPTPGCNGRRVKLKYSRKPGSANASVSGKCPRCGEVHEFSFDAGSPDLTEIVDMISPRVDSRQVIVDSVIPVLAHVGGPGETSYYAEVIPAAKALGIPFPVYLRYNRTFYNTPWNAALAERVREKGHPTIAGGGLFSALSGWVDARNAGDGEKLRGAHSDIKGSIEASYSGLLNALQSLQSEIDSIKRRLSEPGDRQPLIAEMRVKQDEARLIEHYLSMAFGRFSPEKFGQEVSWAWLDLAAASGLGDVMGVFLREYSENTPNSSMFYVNL